MAKLLSKTLAAPEIWVAVLVYKDDRVEVYGSWAKRPQARGYVTYRFKRDTDIVGGFAMCPVNWSHDHAGAIGQLPHLPGHYIVTINSTNISAGGFNIYTSGNATFTGSIAP